MIPVISLTTMPRRGPQIEPVLDSLLAQGYPVFLWVPRDVTRTGDKWGKVPEFFRKVNWAWVDDQGPATKLLPALKQFDTVIVADDDMVYGPGWADGLVAWAEKLPQCAVAYRGRLMKRGVPYAKSKVVSNPPEPMEVGLITGVYGVLYRREFFADTIFEEWRDCPLNDDVMVSAHLRKRGVPMMVVPRPCTITKQPQWHTQPIHWVNRKGKTDLALREVYWT